MTTILTFSVGGVQAVTKRSVWRNTSVRRGRLHEVGFRRSRVTVRATVEDSSSTNATPAFTGSSESSLEDSTEEIGQQNQQSGWTELPRKILLALSLCGLFETLFLTYKKLIGGGLTSICTTAGCLEVLGGPYSTVMGVPLTLFGMGGYALAVLLSAYPLLTQDKAVALKRDQETRSFFVMLVTAMATFSNYLMMVLFGVIRGWCPWCIFSAFTSDALAVLVISRSISVPKTVRRAVSTSLLTAAMALGVFVTTPGGVLDPLAIHDPPVVTKASTPETLAVANGLERKKTKMYGAFWCTHCYSQKQLLGKEAMEKIEYIECAEKGRNSQAKLCRDKSIPGYPAWEINGKLYFGEQTLEDFKEIINTGTKANDPYATLLEDLKEAQE